MLHLPRAPLVLCAALLPLAGCGRAESGRNADVSAWLAGNLHAHTNLCDHADSSPAEVVRWYHDHGYDFVCLSEHDLFLEPDALELDFSPRPGFFVLRGAEINYPDIRYTLVKHVRMGSLGGASFTARSVAGTAAGQLQEMVRDVHLGGGVPVLHHPTYLKCVAPADVLPIEGLHLFEVFNGAWQEPYPVGAESLTAEAMWDLWLTAGRVLYAVAADDAHRYRPGSAIQTPGRGWVCVGARERTPEAVLDALQGGEFYASTGVVLKQLRRGPDEYLVVVDEEATVLQERGGLLAPEVSQDGAPGTRIEWIGPDGALLATIHGAAASFALTTRQAYVRCRVSHTWPVERGYATCHAWTQPAFTDGRKLPRQRRR